MQNVAAVLIVVLAGAYLAWRFLRRAGRGAPCDGCNRKETCAGPDDDTSER